MSVVQYFDRKGRGVLPDAQSIIKPRSGAWFILRHGDFVLVVYPECAPDVPEFPGGGIDPGENAIDAARRELLEEAELVLPAKVNIETTHQQFVRFFAEFNDEMWDYSQEFFLITQGLEGIFFLNERKVEEGIAKWVPVSDLRGLHYMHHKALVSMGLADL